MKITCVDCGKFLGFGPLELSGVVCSKCLSKYSSVDLTEDKSAEKSIMLTNITPDDEE